MADTRTAPSTGRFEVRVTADSHFAWVRTRLSLERTMMSWLRTAVALIGFGFAIVQYLEHLEETPGARAAYLPHAPRYLGLALIATAMTGDCFPSFVSPASGVDGSLHVGRTVHATCGTDKEKCKAPGCRRQSARAPDTAA